MPPLKTGRPRASETEPRASLRWIDGRAYAEMGAWAPWGGRRQEPLVAEGEATATRDRNVAALLFADRLRELRTRRECGMTGAGTSGREVPTRIVAFIGFHLAAKADVKGRKRPSPRQLALLKSRLLYAARFLRTLGIHDVRQIDPASAEAYMEHLAGEVEPSTRGRGGRRTDRLGPGTQRKYLDALANLLKRAKSKGIIRSNVVEDLVDKPTAESSPTEHLERWEAALLLEVARRLHPLSRPGTPYYPLLAWELLTGCIESETKSRERSDVRLPGDPEFPDGVVMVRANGTRDRLKTAHRTRYLQLQPQLAEILRAYLASAQAPTGRLLFPGTQPDVPIGDWRGVLDRIAQVAGFEPGTVRTLRFRPTFATHRAYTCDEMGQPMTALKLRAEMGHGTLKMLEERYFKAARFRRSLPHLEYRWSEWAEVHRPRLAAGLATTLSEAHGRLLASIAAGPLPYKAWQESVGEAPSTFCYLRDRLLDLELVERDRDGRGALWSLTDDGEAVLASMNGRRRGRGARMPASGTATDRRAGRRGSPNQRRVAA